MLIPITFVFRCSRQWWLLYVITVMVCHEASSSPPGCLRPQAVRHGRALCHLSRHISTKLLSQGRQLRTGKSDVYHQPIASLSPESSRVKEDPSLPSRSRDNVFVSDTLMTRPAACASRTKRCWTLAEDLLSEWEERKKSRAGGGAPCESRKIVLWALLLWQAIPVTIRLQRGCWATSGRGSSRRALQVCLS